MIEVVNRQRKIVINTDAWRDFAVRAAEVVTETNGKSLTIAFVSDNKMRGLNGYFRHNDKTTDVLSFPSEPDEFEADDSFLGDIVISLEQARKQAAENGLDFETEIKQLILHGILHLCGFDHEKDNGEMNARELNLRVELGI